MDTELDHLPGCQDQGLGFDLDMEALPVAFPLQERGEDDLIRFGRLDQEVTPCDGSDGSVLSDEKPTPGEKAFQSTLLIEQVSHVMGHEADAFLRGDRLPALSEHVAR